VFGNCIGIARFETRAKELTFESINVLDHRPENALEMPSYSDGGMNSYPFAYVQSDLPDVYSSMLPAMTRSIHREMKYVSRHSGRPQTPLQTLTLGSGTCRDFAVLMMEGARALGLAARFVSGYLHIPQTNCKSGERKGGGNMHAWVRVFLPNGGWVEFDPTNGLVGNRDLIRVAVVRDPDQALPLSGTWEGESTAYLGMDVEVEVTARSSSELEGGPFLHKIKA
jgi:transglutaminase-like putative cysteine protease